MANHSEAQYTAWIRDITGIEALEAQVKPGDPMESLAIVLRHARDDTQEIFRIPTRFAYTQELLEKHLPSHLHNGNTTLNMRIGLADILNNAELLDECLAAFPEFRTDMDDIAGKAKEIELLGAGHGLIFHMRESKRQLQEWLLTMMDTDIMRLQRFVDARVRNH